MADPVSTTGLITGCLPGFSKGLLCLLALEVETVSSTLIAFSTTNPLCCLAHSFFTAYLVILHVSSQESNPLGYYGQQLMVTIINELILTIICRANASWEAIC